ncbi:MAG: UDP-glucose 4-epimerase GalE [Acidobacteriota bacterium]|nr:UDP-glucose 4-epimerase GalE [Acidobacteriota bacterium]MDQ7086451.1 UDP-glucose 4-epimerase GalE [Acidobacteriota bacterium]
MKVLVSGGAGYIGGFVARSLEERGHGVVVLDDFSTGHRGALGGWPLVELRCGETEAVAAAMKARGIEAVVHLSALSLVGESVRDPGRYWRENVGQAAGLLDACRRAGVERFVLSSTAAVYGEPEQVPIVEEHPLRPTNPYGATKVAIEQMLAHFQDAAGLGWVSLRYFNAAGAAPDGSLGEDHAPETHLLPLAFAAAQGTRGPLTIFGDDWPTPDGTCLRDYVHVVDLAAAHVLALEWLEAHPRRSLVANLGGGAGTSVREVIDAVARAAGREVPHSVGPRRAGDPAVLVAATGRARRELGWRPEHSSIEEIARDAWAWHRAHPRGFGEGA